jgi:hypothetical protein
VAGLRGVSKPCLGRVLHCARVEVKLEATWSCVGVTQLLCFNGANRKQTWGHE